MASKRIETKGAPAAIGPYSQAITSGEWIFCSGQIPIDPISGEVVGRGDIEAQTRQVLRNLEAVLAASGATRRDVVKATVYLIDMAEFSKMNQVYAQFFEGCTAPARVCVQAAALPKGVDVEIDFIARTAG
ncbi:MAG: Rid family detoxifying hydrolase [Polyangiales bacterium]